MNRGIREAPALAFAASLALTILVYWPGLYGPLVFDDPANLAPINDWLAGRTGWASVVFGNDSGLFGRSLAMASFVLNVKLLGPETWGLKLGNLLIHLVNGILVFAFFRLLSRRIASRTPAFSTTWLPWLGASIWLLHPLFASTVLYVVQRMAMLSALFTLAALIAYLVGRNALEERRMKPAIFLLALAVPAATLAATLSKENGVLAPALCAILEWFIYAPAVGTRRHPASRAFLCAVLVVPVIVAGGLTLGHYHLIVDDYAGRQFTLVERLMTEARILWDYIGTLLVPRGSQLGFYHDDFSVSHGLLDPPSTLLAITAWLSVCILAWRCRRATPGFATGLGIYLVGHGLESTVFPLMLYFEHRNYLPGVGALWAIVSLLAPVTEAIRTHVRRPNALLAASACMLVLVMAAGTNVRAYVWKDQRSIIRQAVIAHPDSRGARFDSIALELAPPPDFARARQDADRLRNSRDVNTRLVGSVERVLVDCSAVDSVDPALVREVFDSHPGPFEEDVVHAFEFLSDRVGAHPCAGLSPGELAENLVHLLDNWEPAAGTGASWRLRFRASNLYMAADRMPEAIAQVQLAYGHGNVPTNTAIMMARVLIACGDTETSSRILDDVDKKIRADEKLAREIIVDSRARIRILKASLPAHDHAQ